MLGGDSNVTKTLPFLVFPLPSWLRHCLPCVFPLRVSAVRCVFPQLKMLIAVRQCQSLPPRCVSLTAVVPPPQDALATELAAELRPVAAALANPVVIFAGGSTGCADATPVSHALPPQLELLSLQMLPPGMNITLIDDSDTQYNASTGTYPAPPVGSAVVLLRLRHLFAAGDGGGDSELGKPVSVDIASLFAPLWTVTKVRVSTKVVYTHGGPIQAAVC